LAAIEFIVEALVPSAYLRTPVLGTSPATPNAAASADPLVRRHIIFIGQSTRNRPQRAHYETLFTSSCNIVAAGAYCTVFAQEKAALQPNATVVSLLQGSAGKSVELHLRSGEKMCGKIAQVTDNVVHLSNLTGPEYFDAFVDVKDISAVVVRVAGR
jgi:hypothetical protein